MKRVCVIGDCIDVEAGGGRFANEILDRLDKMVEKKSDIEISIFFYKRRVTNFKKYKNISLIKTPYSNKLVNLLWIVHYINKNGMVMMDLNNGVPICRKNLICIFDVRAMECKEYDKTRIKIRYQLIKFFAKINKIMVVTISNYQKNKISSLLSLTENNIKVVPCGWNHIKCIREDNSVFEKYPCIDIGNYFLSIGSIAKHKNYKWIHEVAKRNLDKQFVIIGNISKKKWGINEKELELHNVIFTGRISDEQTKALMKKCKCFLHPSKYEGFGIPPLEALSLGKKIIISNATCLPEIYGQCASYFNPDDYGVNLDNLVGEKNENPNKLIQKYDWDNSAKEIYNLLLK